MDSAKNIQSSVEQDETEVIISPMKPQDEPSKERNGVRTLLLVGRRDNGKSATGNSILGEEKFKSILSFNGVTNTCELQTTVLENGLTLNVIDTPGLCGVSLEHEFIGNDIVRCIDMVKGDIHAVLLVLSATCPFSINQAAAITSLQNFFGHRISDYMVVVFTRGDELEENGDTLDDCLGRGCPAPLREILDKCGNRKVVFDNKSKDKVKRTKQLNELLFLVDEVVNINSGKPFADEIFAEMKKGEVKLVDESIQQHNSFREELVKNFRKEVIKSHNMQLVKEKLKETILRLGLQLTEEREARLRVSLVIRLRNLGCDYFIFSTGIISKCSSGSKEIR